MTTENDNTTPLEAIGEENEDSQGWMFWSLMAAGGVIGICLLLFVIAVGIGIWSESTSAIADFVIVIRELLIIMLVLQGILFGLGIIIIIYQLASLLRLLENEIDPVVETAQDTANTVQGTAQFISRHLTEPIIKTQSRISQARRFTTEATGLQQLLEFYERTLENNLPTADQTPEEADSNEDD